MQILNISWYNYSAIRQFYCPIIGQYPSTSDARPYRVSGIESWHESYASINLTVVGIYEQKWNHLHARKVKFMEGVGI